ncbi:MAG: methyltransferase domain-containing protein [Chloroflexi bacterium]|nr:methyltransferase domain-containing protein [Chloroflexota bacterium]
MDTQPNTSKGTRGLELTELNWLLDHHKAKESERRQMVEDLGLKPGDRVLDLGCGPGLWTPMFARMVGQSGKVIGVDFDEALIDYARNKLENKRFAGVLEFQVGDFYDIPFADNTFDLVFFGNCLAYVTDQPRVLAELKRVTRQGGRVVVKDFDGAVLVVHPIDPVLSAKVLAATAQGLRERPPQAYFDNYVGRKLPGALREAGLLDVKTTSYAIQKMTPLTEEAKRYIAGNARWYVSAGAQHLSSEEVWQWRAHFDPESPSYVLDRDDFYFCMLELVAEGRACS